MKHLFVLGAVCLVLTGCTNLGGDAMIESDLVYADRPSGELSGHLFRPQGDGPHRAVVVIHGGGWRGGEPWHMGHVSRRLANDGFVVFTPTYRFTPEHVHPAQLNDVRDAYRWLAAQSFVDRANIAVWGYSAGAHLTLMLGLAPESAGGLGDGERPIALIGGGSPTDFNLFSADEALIVQLIGRERGDDPEAWEAASPISWVTGDDPPVYLYHGSLDRVQRAEQIEGAVFHPRDDDGQARVVGPGADPELPCGRKRQKLRQWQVFRARPVAQQRRQHDHRRIGRRFEG